MFDHVAWPVACPVCGNPEMKWQTKDGDCLLETLTPAQLVDRSPRRDAAINFYDHCGTCQTWIEVTLRPPDVGVSWVTAEPAEPE